jgi:hypothetical protein
MIYIVNPDLEIPDILDACPEDVQDQLRMANQFEDILEDCYSYREWLMA